jgi:hypothetical protein
MAGASLVTIGKCIKSSFNHSVSVVVYSSDTSYASTVDLVKIVCLWDLHKTAVPPIVNVYPRVALIVNIYPHVALISSVSEI